MSVEEQTIEAPVSAGEEAEMTPEELAAKLDQLKASATQQYSLKNYAVAADFYSEAAEIQDKINGEMSPMNADLLYQYGRCLYHVAVAQSDVLGGKVASSEEPKRKKRKVSKAEGGGTAAAREDAGVTGDALQDREQKLAEDVVEAVVEEKDETGEEVISESKPYFQITGDENFTDSEDEDEDAADAEAEEEEDDFATAFEVLDMARILLSKKLDASPDSKENEAAIKAEQRQLRERLADTHDLQAEISLENERFHDAIKDTRDALSLKMELYPQESSLIAEAHYKLSLALEFASVTSTADAEGHDSEKTIAKVDTEMRTEAVQEMEKAIASCTLRITKEEAAIASLSNPATAAEQKKSVAEVKGLVADMKQRLVDLHNPAVSLSGPTGPAGAPDRSDPVRGLLGDLLGESKVEQQKRIAEATEKANDLTGLVKHRKKPKTEEATNANDVIEGKGKRKAEDVNGVDGVSGKKVKFEDGA